MKFMNYLSQKKLAKAVVFGLLVSGGMLVGLGQAYADAPKAWISGAEKQTNGNWYGKAGTEVRITAEEHSGAKPYDGGNINGVDAQNGGKVTIEGGTIEGTVLGGDSNNTVTINSGTFNSRITGGGSDNNTTIITGGTFNNKVVGGGRRNNTVIITGGTFNDSVVGVFSHYNGNTITIGGGTFNSNIIGCDLYSYRVRDPKGCTINLIGEGGRLKVGENYIENKNEIYIKGTVYGFRTGNNTSSAKDYTLNVAGKNIYAEYLDHFQNINFYINNTVENGDTLLKIKGASAGQGLKLQGITVKAGVETGSKLVVGNKVTLIESELGVNLPSKRGRLDVNDFIDYGVRFEVENGKKLIGKIVEGPKPREDADSPVKSPVETQIAGLNMLTTGADMLAGQGFENAAAAVAGEVSEGGSAKSLTPFVTVGGAKTRVNSGSHVDVKGWHLNVGLAKELKNKSGKLLIGPVVEYGKGSYDSYLDDGFHGEGKTRYIGGGVMAKQTNDNGFYYEGSLRAGKLSNDYKSHEISFNKFDSDATYYAAHVGLGKILKLNGKNTLDYYGKYFYTHQKGKDATLYADGSPIDLHFDSLASNRTRLGARFTHALSEKNSIYAGLAWQHEFSGTARATMDASGTPAPSVKGNTGIMELGWKVEAGKQLDLDLNATGYTGKQKGVGLNLAVNFKF